MSPDGRKEPKRRFFGRCPFAEPVLSGEILRFVQNDKGSEGLRASTRNKFRNLRMGLLRLRLAMTMGEGLAMTRPLPSNGMWWEGLLSRRPKTL